MSIRNSVSKKYIYLVALYYLFTMVLMMYYSNESMTALMLKLGVFLLPIAAIIKTDEDCRYDLEGLSVIFFFFLLWTFILYRTALRQTKHGLDKLTILSWLSITLCIMICMVRCRNDIRKTLEKFFLKGHIKSSIPLLVVLIVFIAISVPTIIYIPLFDDGAYYSWGSISELLEGFDVRFDDIKNYMFAYHVSNGYGLLALLGEMISPHTSYGVHFINILLATMSGVAFYRILIKHYPDKKLQAVLFTAAYLFSPYITGLIWNINVDIPGIYLLIILYECYTYERDICFTFIAWMYVCTKETNAVNLSFMIIGIAIKDILEEDKNVFATIKNKLSRYLIYIIPIVFWVLYFFSPEKRNMALFTPDSLISDGGVHRFGLSISNIAARLSQIFVQNFAWLISLAIILAIIILLKENGKLSLEIIPLLMVLLSIVLFNCLYIDYLHTRYIMQAMPVLILILAMHVIPIQRLRYIMVISGIICILLFAQSFVSFDPVSNAIYSKVNTGTRQIMLDTTGASTYYDGSIYNRQSYGYIRDFEKMLLLTEYNEDTILVYSNYSNSSGPIWYGYNKPIFFDRKRGRLSLTDGIDKEKLRFAKDEKEAKNYPRILAFYPSFNEGNNNKGLEGLNGYKECNSWTIGSKFKIDVIEYIKDE